MKAEGRAVTVNSLFVECHCRGSSCREASSVLEESIRALGFDGFRFARSRPPGCIPFEAFVFEMLLATKKNMRAAKGSMNAFDAKNYLAHVSQRKSLLIPATQPDCIKIKQVCDKIISTLWQYHIMLLFMTY